jgi:hypothetical protein
MTGAAISSLFCVFRQKAAVTPRYEKLCALGKANSGARSATDFLTDGGEMARLVREKDWAATPRGRSTLGRKACESLHREQYSTQAIVLDAAAAKKRMRKAAERALLTAPIYEHANSSRKSRTQWSAVFGLMSEAHTQVLPDHDKARRPIAGVDGDMPKPKADAMGADPALA